MSLSPLIERHLPLAIELRHRLHQIPELRYEEIQTAATIRAELDRLNIKHIDGVAGAPTATIATIGEASRGCIALRADIDGLPINEATGLPYASTHPGRMHACGHDGHSANLVGVASMLKSLESKLPVCVKLIWQPAEEGGAGAEKLVQAGVLDGRLGPKVEAIFGLHGWPGLKVGLVSTKPGPILAATDSFTVQFRGRGCHGAYPHLGRDPIVAMAEAIINLQQVVSRDIDPTDSAVVTVGIVNGGSAINVIPDLVQFSGTARSLHSGMRKKLRESMERRCSGIAQAHDCELMFTWEEGYPPTTNDPAMAEYVIKVARQTLGDQNFIPVNRPSMGGEDFAYYLEKIPGCFFFVGVEPLNTNGYPPLHSDRFDFTDSALPIAMRMFGEIVMNWGTR
jgi:amidohydrolase